jgi:carboxymethylenebutenolidase
VDDVHGDIDRRGFIDRASRYGVGGLTAAMLLDALNPRFAEAQQVPKDDAAVSATRNSTMTPMAKVPTVASISRQ